MKLYLGAPKALLHPTGLGYALAHEMDNETTIQKYRALNHLILDNGADELGEGQSGARLAYLAGKLNPELLILPDVLHKPRKTWKKSVEFLGEIKYAGYSGNYIAVVQDSNYGKACSTILDWSNLYSIDGVYTLGITYDTRIVTDNPSPESWMRRLDFLEKFVGEFAEELEESGARFHLLGTLEVQELYRLFYDPRYSQALRYVESHDTTAPYACPTKFLVGKEISFGRKKDWKAQNFNRGAFSTAELEVINWNVACYLAACRVEQEQWTRYLSREVAVTLYSQFQHYYV